MTLDIGINFRATAAYVTDGANETYCLADAYPTTRGGVTFGWTTATPDGTRNRNASLDRRLAGVNRTWNNAAQIRFQLDLPASGAYDVHLALGDYIGEGYLYGQILDDAAPLITIDDANGTTGGSFDDATGAGYSAAAWPGSEQPTRVTFATQTLRLAIGTGTAGTPDSSTIAHLRVVQVAPSGVSATVTAGQAQSAQAAATESTTATGSAGEGERIAATAAQSTAATASAGEAERVTATAQQATTATGAAGEGERVTGSATQATAATAAAGEAESVQATATSTQPTAGQATVTAGEAQSVGATATISTTATGTAGEAERVTATAAQTTAAAATAGEGESVAATASENTAATVSAGEAQSLAGAATTALPGAPQPLSIRRIYAGPAVRVRRLYAGPVIRIRRVRAFPA